jgi:hypothetical protein
MQTQLSHTNTPLEHLQTVPLVLDLTLLLTLPTHSTTCPSTPPLDSHPTEPLSRPRKLSMRFPSPTTQSLGMHTALAWHQEQLLEARQKLDLRNRNRIQAGLLPVTNPLITKMTSVSVPSVCYDTYILFLGLRCNASLSVRPTWTDEMWMRPLSTQL